MEAGIIRENKLACRTDAAEAISKLLSAPVKLYTSRCILRELHALGPEFKGGARSVFKSMLSPAPLRRPPRQISVATLAASARSRCGSLPEFTVQCGTVPLASKIWVFQTARLHMRLSEGLPCAAAIKASRSLMVLHCGHEEHPVTPGTCLATVLGAPAIHPC